MIFYRVKDIKPHFWPILAPFCPNLGPNISFFESRASSLFSTPLTLTLCNKSKKTNDGKYENFCHGQTDGRTDRQTDGRSWFHRTRQAAGRVQKLSAPMLFIQYSTHLIEKLHLQLVIYGHLLIHIHRFFL